MKKSILFASLFLFILASAFRPIAGLDEVIRSLKGGNATDLARYIDERVEITLPDKSSNYSKSQAMVILKDFFVHNGVRGFEVKHKGDNGGNQFCVGTLQTRSGNYRAMVFMKSKNGRQLVKAISFQSN
ncbi:MAG TPA: DUF4783 domain-containing protein [Chitinophagaceae bacterium]|nr:DUF4783 domain-containing protein [Chitinophagaceae bacterium]